MRNPKLVFDWQRAASESAKKGWESRWEKAYEEGRPVSGDKGKSYLEWKYGVEVQSPTGGSRGGGRAGGGSGGGGRRDEWFDEWPDYDDYDFYDGEEVSP